MGGDDVRATAAVCRAFLTGTLGRDWTAPIPGMTWTVAEAVAHVAQGLLWYAVDLSAGPRELRTTELRVRPDSPPADLLTTIDAHAAVLAATIDAAPADARGWEPWGLPDPDGFAAVACDELLIHTDDAARGLGLAFTPPAAQAEATLRRLFPWAPADTGPGGDPRGDPRRDPRTTLRWANGRTDLPGRRRQTDWRWHCAPLAEWDGTNPTG
jgi:uncharacterized protein (TIGR03083 family)